jgi:hypothetical protein
MTLTTSPTMFIIAPHVMVTTHHLRNNNVYFSIKFGFRFSKNSFEAGDFIFQ